MTSTPILTKRMRLILRMAAAATKSTGADPHITHTAAQAAVDNMTDADVDDHLMEGEDG